MNSAEVSNRSLTNDGFELTNLTSTGLGSLSGYHGRTRKPDAGLDVEALVRATVSKIEAQGATEGDRLRATMRKAIAMLEAAVG